MFTEIDKILYPNRCEVIEVAPQRFLFPMFKNGSSSLMAEANRSGWKILFNEQIQRCDVIDIFLRDPKDRIASGAGSFYDDMAKWSNGLDPKTILAFMDEYPYLNRHYLPQIHWLVWLGRYMRSDAVLRLLNVDQISTLTDYRKGGRRSDDPTKLDHIADMPKAAPYIELDQHLHDLIGRELSLREILLDMASEHKHAYDHVFGHAKKLADVLP